MTKAQADKRLAAIVAKMMAAPVWPPGRTTEAIRKNTHKARWAIARDHIVEAWRCFEAGSKGPEQREQIEEIDWRAGKQGRRKLAARGLIPQEATR